jgi:DNA-directed RNA polymerase specialized sigma subunit
MTDRPGRFYAIPAPERDRMILQLRRAGWTLKRIGRRVGMSESGVKRSLDRIAMGGFGEGMTRA